MLQFGKQDLSSKQYLEIEGDNEEVERLEVLEPEDEDDGPVIPFMQPPFEEPDIPFERPVIPIEDPVEEPVIPISIPKLQVEEKPLPSPVIPLQHVDAFNEMKKQVQERTEMAMAQLHRSPQQTGQTRYASPTNTTRKRIHPQDISSPLLVQSSASVDKIPTVPTVPVANPLTPVRSPSSKLSFGIKRLRNTLKGKSSAPNGEEITPWTNYGYMNSPNSSRFANNGSAPLSPSSTSDLRVVGSHNVPTPPTSASAEKKGFSFISRFRRRGPSETSNEGNGSSSLGSSMLSSTSISPVDRNIPSMPHSGPSSVPSSVSKGHRPDIGSPSAINFGHMNGQSETNQTPIPTSPNSSMAPTDPAALRKFMDAAESLGLNQSAVNDFLALNSPRSPEPTPLSATFSRSDVDVSRHRESPPMIAPIERIASPISENFIENSMDLLRRPSTSQRNYLAPTGTRRVRELSSPSGNSDNAIVRRTIYIPSANGNNGSTPDLTTLTRKMSKSVKRASGMSMQSGRSVHDRVPTPPPPARAKRFSADGSPPVPSLAARWGDSLSRGFSDAVGEKSTPALNSM